MKRELVRFGYLFLLRREPNVSAELLLLLHPPEVLRDEATVFPGAQAKAAVPIKRKESCRWLENMRQPTALLAEPERVVHIGDR